VSDGDGAEDGCPKPAKPTLVIFRGGPHDGSVHTDDDCDRNVFIARFLAFLYEETGNAEAGGNFNPDSPVVHRYTLASVEESDELRTLVVDHTSHQRG
jgi:hypothetical protein